MYDQVFQEQEQMGVIERIDNIAHFMERHPDCSFLPHMGVFRPHKETTKVRVVFLSNLCEKNESQPTAVSHNEALLPGPCLNSKLSTSLLLARFDKYILTKEAEARLDKMADTLKAYPNIALEVLGHTDSNGSNSYNWTLAIRRSSAVIKYLERKGIKPDRFAFKGFGETQPVETNTTDSGRAINRRVEFRVLEEKES